MLIIKRIRTKMVLLPPNVQGIIWMGMAGMIFASFMGIVRHVGTSLDPIQVAFLRYGLGLIFMLPFFLQVNLVDLRNARFGLHAFRGILHACGVMCWFYAMSRIPIADVTAIGFTGPVFATIGAAVFLGETVKIRRIVAVTIGLLGAVIILRPGFVEIELGALLMLIAAPIFAVSDLLSKVLTRRETAPALVAYLSIFVTITILVPAIYVWKTPTIEEWAWMFLTAGLATLGHLCMMNSVKIAELSAVQPIKFLQLLWAALIGFLIFSEVPEIWTWVGSTVIVASSTYIAHREAVVRKSEQLK
jgi:drug/metabolite transporter (DMT)-like permease